MTVTTDAARTPRTAKVERFQRKPVFVEAVQFKDWGSAIDIMESIPGAGIYYVPTGAEHPFRTEPETDRGNGHILDNAPPFLVVPARPTGLRRLNLQGWVVLEGGVVYGVDATPFTNQYVPAPDGEG